MHDAGDRDAARAVLTRPDGLGTVFGDRPRTWREIGGRVARLAGAIQALGIGPVDRVAAMAMNSDRFLELLHAVPWAGVVFAPLSIRRESGQEHWQRQPTPAPVRRAAAPGCHR